tara:strand:- start:86 stop:265 length:180 start_codon:yes stop_codon:yes gene_type:complete
VVAVELVVLMVEVVLVEEDRVDLVFDSLMVQKWVHTSMFKLEVEEEQVIIVVVVEDNLT